MIVSCLFPEFKSSQVASKVSYQWPRGQVANLDARFDLVWKIKSFYYVPPTHVHGRFCGLKSFWPSGVRKLDERFGQIRRPDEFFYYFVFLFHFLASLHFSRIDMCLGVMPVGLQ